MNAHTDNNKLEADLNELRALALIIGSQSLQIRRSLQEEILANAHLSVLCCQARIPKIDWQLAHSRAVPRIKTWQQMGMQITSIFEDSYPAALKEIEDPPLIIFSKGRPLSDLSGRCCLAVVGSRRADFEGLELTQQFSRELSKLGVVIISGLALGIDGAAHVGALQSQVDLATVAVLGSGLNLIYPPRHSILGQQIINSGGMVISQFDPDMVPYPANFLNRNRIVSGLSKAVLVVEATLKSGSLVTARNALEQGKDVLVVPGDIYNPRFEGSNRLIQQGATLVTCVRDIIEALGLEEISDRETSADNKNQVPIELTSKIERQIFEILKKKKEIRVDELLRQFGQASFEKELLMLEFQGIIERLPGNVLRLKRG